MLPCGQPQEVQFTFYGHADIACSVIAACKVEGGPTYRVRLSGEASRVQYKFNTTTVDVGPHVCLCSFTHIKCYIVDLAV